ncbi:MAG: hypothetical protein HZB51_32420 [Chloroflexi bacterium]|nr:hypothetical protein [Chloroflexota bacterium]
MREVLGCFARLGAVFCAISFVVFAVLALLLFNVDWQLGHPDLYKQALVDAKIYEHLPSLAGEMLDQGMMNPCAENPQQESCQLEEQVSPTEHPLYFVFASSSVGMQACLKASLGDETYRALAAAERQPKNAELQRIKPCVKRIPILANSEASGPPLFVWLLDRSDWEMIIATLLPATWLQSQVENVITQLFAYLDGKTDAVKFSLVDLKTRLAGDAGPAILMRILAAQPPCSASQLAQMENLRGGLGKIICRPPDGYFASRKTELQQAIGELVASWPDETTLVSNETIADSASDDSLLGNDPRTAISRVRLALRFMMVLPLVFFLLMTLLAVRSLQGLLRWWGIPLLIVGTIAAGLSLLILLGFDSFTTNLVSTQRLTMMGFTPNLTDTFRQIAQSIARGYASWLGIEAAIHFAIGLAFLASSFLLQRNPMSV